MIELSETVGRLTVTLKAQPIGLDWNILVYGGNLPHVGAVALASPNTTCSVLCLPNHREGEIAERIASAIVEHVNASVCVTCGIHLDNITQHEICSVGDIIKMFISELVARIQS
ncbi:MAG: hypothetical protein FWG02_11120 [Holophagaceae bacterium]|nr:hypothetical protein [Holophagaceae bacterium]